MRINIFYAFFYRYQFMPFLIIKKYLKEERSVDSEVYEPKSLRVNVNEPRNLMQLGELKPFMWLQAIGLLEVNDLTNPKKVQTPGSKASASI